MNKSRICKVDGCDKPIHGNGLCDNHCTRLRHHGSPLGGRKGTSHGEPLRFLNEVVITYDGDDCLFWPYGKAGKGYGKIWVNGRNALVHRLVCETAHGAPRTMEHEAAHSCGNGHLGCVSPNHLSWKTPAENAADKMIHGTHSRGERHVSAKLTEANVMEIRRLASTTAQAEIGRLFGVTQTNVSAIVTGKTWNCGFLK